MDSGSQPSDDLVTEIDRLCDEARFVSAYRLVSDHAAFESWRSPHARCTAARLVQHLGGSARARRLALSAYRANPSFAEARFWVGMEWLGRRGPLAAWRWLSGYEPPPGTPARSVASVLWLRAMIATTLRDFDEAERQLERADAVAPAEPYGNAVRVGWLSAQDRYDDALSLARSGAQRHPTHRPSIEALAELLQVHARFEEALAVLLEAAPKVESSALWFAAARLQQELGRHRESFESLDLAERLCPLLEDKGKQRIAAMRADAAYFCGDEATALSEARKVDSPFFRSLVERLEKPAKSRRTVQLDVAFVRQHRLTCVPATLSMLGRFWDRPVDHLELADQICYDGTRAHSERVWASTTGWTWRELTVSWEVARALLDRGVPFAVDTVHVVSAHTQAVVGYDERRETITIRDPYVPTKLEALAAPFFADYAAHGPRGFAFVPPERAELLSDVELPDAELFALADAVESALEKHDRTAAAAHAAELEAREPDHRLVLSVRRALAAYDANPFELLKIAETALTRFPNEPTWQIARLNALRETSTSERHREELEKLCADQATHPVFREMLAAELTRDARDLERAARMLRRVATELRERAAPVSLLADCHWYARDFDRAMELHRFAACLEPTNDSAAQDYFRAALARGRPEEALAFLERRAERHRKQAAGPTIAAFVALEQIDRTHRGFELLAAALEVRPDDGDLLAFATLAHARYGELEAAEACLRSAERCLPRHRWARVAARVATLSAEHERAIELWREVVDALPLDVDAHAALAARIAAVHGQQRARAHTAAASARFPENAALLGLHVQWLTDEDPRLLETALRRLIELEPANAWARRELALTLAKLGCFAEANAECALALEVAPLEESGQLVTARLAELEGHFEVARKAYRAALELSPDSAFAIARLVELANDTDECREMLDSIQGLVLKRSLSGDGLNAWYQAARRHLSPEDVAKRLELVRNERSELWASWLCGVQHLRYMGDGAGAVALARTAVERCPLVPGLWLELANALRAERAVEEERAALERAVAMSPGFVAAVLALANALERGAADDRGLSAIERGLRFQPLDMSLLLARADVLWRLQRRDDAISALRRAIEVDSTDGDAWSRLREWDQSEDFDAAAAVEQLAERRHWDAAMWFRLAEIQSESDPGRALQTIDRSLALDPTAVDAHDLRAAIATSLGHRALALSACRPAHFGDRIPLPLRGREAWVLAQFGEVRQAIARMREVVAERPDYGWGWRQIADFAEQLNDTETGLEAARALVRLEPNAAFVHGYLGQALAEAGQTDEALSTFRRAIRIDPAYRYGVHRYLELLLQRRDLLRAERALKRHARHLPPHDVPLWRLRFAIATSNWKAAGRHARAFFANPDASEWALESVRHDLASANFALAESALLDVAWQPDAPAHAGTAWARTACQRFDGPSPRLLARLVEQNPEAGAEAIDVVLHHLGDHARALTALFVVVRNWQTVRSRDKLWGAFGYVLANAGFSLLAILWLWSYERRQPKPWMLLNLVAALRSLGFAAAARRVGHDALSLPPDSSFPAHAVWLALDAAVEGSSDEAALLLADVGAGQLSPYFERVHALVGTILELDNCAPGERASCTESAFYALDCVHSRGFLSVLSIEAIQWRRAARRIGRASASLSGLLRGHWDSLLAPLVIPALAYAVLLTGGRILIWAIIIAAIGTIVRRGRFA